VNIVSRGRRREKGGGRTEVGGGRREEGEGRREFPTISALPHFHINSLRRKILRFHLN